MHPALEEIRDHNHFETFAADYLAEIGFEIVKRPGEGPDGGKDLIVAEQSKLILGNQVRYVWLVSCKYHVKAVGSGAEIDVIGRLQQHSCNGFMAFYASRPTQGLMEKLYGQQETTVAQVHQFGVMTINGDDIVSRLTSDERLHPVAHRHLPVLYASKIQRKIINDKFATGGI